MGASRDYKVFLSKGVNVDDTYTEKGGHTTLHCAVNAGKSGVVKFLIKEGANIYAKDNDGKTPLDYAREGGHMEIVNILSSAENKSQLSKTTRGTDDKPESDLSSVTVKNQQRSLWHR